MSADGRETVSQSTWARWMKRPVDIVVSAAALLLAAPVLGIAVAVIRLTSAGPVFFPQERIGKGGIPFTPHKLRTMRAGRAADFVEIIPLDHEEITRVGRVVRRFKIDELPQLLNVLKGEMSLVGPRPTHRYQTDAYRDFERRRLLVRPGLTGLAQVNGNASISWAERFKYDVYYVDNHNFLMDLRILAKTVPVLMKGEEHFARPFGESDFAPREEPA